MRRRHGNEFIAMLAYPPSERITPEEVAKHAMLRFKHTRGVLLLNPLLPQRRPAVSLN
jgi:hypothetical protein